MVSNTGRVSSRRAADYCQDFGGGGLLLQGLAQLVEQAGVLDGDDGLRGEVREQRDLPVGEETNFLAKDADDSNHRVILEQRRNDDGPKATKLDSFNDGLMACRITWVAEKSASCAVRLVLIASA